MILFTVTGQAILANRACENFKNVTRVVNLQFSGEARPAERHCERPHRRKVGIHPQVEIFRLPHIVVGGERHGAASILACTDNRLSRFNSSSRERSKHELPRGRCAILMIFDSMVL